MAETLKGKTEPRIFTPPLKKLTEENTLGYDFIKFCEDMCGVELMPWQKWWAKHALELVEDEESGTRFRHRYVLTEISRQCGKTFILKLLAAFFNLVLGAKLVIGTAQNLETATEPFEETVAMLEGDKNLKKFIEHVHRGAGKRELKYKTGERYKVVASNRKSGRGLSSDLVIMDELREQRDWEAWSAISKTMMARPNAILFAFTNAGDSDSVVLRSLREQAHAALGDPDKIATSRKFLGGEDVEDGVAIFEWSAPPKCAIDDREAWAQANPALGYGTSTERSLKSSMLTDTEAVFRTENLCQEVNSMLPEPFPEGAWGAGLDKKSCIDETSEIFYGIDMSFDRSYSCIAACGLREDGNAHIEVIEYKLGSAWVVDWFKQRASKDNVMKVAFQGRGTAASGLGEDVGVVEGVEPIKVEGSLLTSGFGRFYDAVARMKPGNTSATGMKVYHLEQPLLEVPAHSAQVRQLGGGAQVFDRKNSPNDCSPLVACSIAFSAMTANDSSNKKMYDSSVAAKDGAVIIL